MKGLGAVFLDVSFSHTKAIQSLAPEEQVALREFVDQGLGAVLMVDNDSHDFDGIYCQIQEMAPAYRLYGPNIAK